MFSGRPAPWAALFCATRALLGALFGVLKTLFIASRALFSVRPETSAHLGEPNALFCARRAQLCALGVLWPCSVRARYSKPAAEPLCVRSHCSKSLFEITVRGSCLGTTVLCFTSLCFTHTGMYMPGSH